MLKHSHVQVFDVECVLLDEFAAGFGGGQGLDHDFVADDLAVLDAKRATAGLAIGASGQSSERFVPRGPSR